MPRSSTLEDQARLEALCMLFGVGLIGNGQVWMTLIQSRNRTTHTFDKTTADEIARAITSCYLAEFVQFQARFAELERAQT